ncbi:UNVERIFIED_ORG: hypothetical protein FHR35_002716 [Microbispora rosea subsp. rosea]
MTSQVRTRLTLWNVDRPEEPIVATAVYSPADPYAMRLSFPGLGEPWTFARALLAEGLEEPVGDGDVRIAPAEAEDWIEIVLFSGQPRECRLFAPRDQVTSFVDRCFRLVPLGREDEWIDWDRQIALIRGVA